ncbi:NADP-dependent 3-hydroxy acid dehydrogenase YdfG [Halopseudomonas xinjiangensis]|uniref:NADP-dependent 3-hydroxy acid dehydrogenase YdfG n=1 Tax=Halopseudomonas xinjiangensis TaxID=487184 RepID=A0A1H1VTW5_9GAMM|nr:SDR family oxidoreductase [Halopseudomonas xinjiangensis]SDS88357.1 NADP-dependent 3-hydroxy acid dehydrogenase YdfG [Halopseudomonas xinjiangensis]
MSSLEHAGKVVVVTGASAGVGRATAVEFARQGATVAILARGQAGLEGARQEIEMAGGRAWVRTLDVADAQAVQAAADAIEAEVGPIDVWVNNAMVTVLSPVAEMTADEYRRVTEVTYLGQVHGTLAALKHMRPRNRGTIVQVGSALAYRAIPLQSAYCAAKFACRGFTDSLRVELMHENSDIHVTTVHLSAFNTPQFDWARTRLPNRAQPVPPIFQPEVAAKGIAWASNQRRREVCVGFPAVKTIWGNKFVPWVADKVLETDGYDGQQTDTPRPDRQDNLFQPVNRDMGSHGRFDQQAKPSSTQLWATMHRRTLAAAALFPVLLIWALNSR